MCILKRLLTVYFSIPDGEKIGLVENTSQKAWRKYEKNGKHDQSILHDLQKQPREIFPKSPKNNGEGVRFLKKLLAERQHFL